MSRERKGKKAEETLEAFLYPSPQDDRSGWGRPVDRFALCDRGVTPLPWRRHKIDVPPVWIRMRPGYLRDCLVAFVDFSRRDGDNIYINDIYVRRDLRGAGYGPILIEAFYDHLWDEVGEGVSIDWGRLERLRDTYQYD